MTTPDARMPPEMTSSLDEETEIIPNTEKTPDPPTISGNRKKRAATSGCESYDAETVSILVECMKKAGYGNKDFQERTRKTVFEKTVAIAAEQHNVTRSATGWQKKYNRMRKAYSAYVAKIQKSGRDGDDPELYDKPDFYEQVHELERHCARHRPPALLSTEMLSEGTDDGAAMSRSRKRVKKEQAMSLEEVEKQNERRHSEMMSQIRERNAQCESFNKMFAELIRKF